MVETMDDQTGSNLMEVTEVITFSAHLSLILGSLAEPVPKFSEIWERAGAIQQSRERFIWQGNGKFNNNQSQGGRVGGKGQFQGQSSAYVQKAIPANSEGISTGQNKVTDERTTVSATTTAASSGTTQQVQIGSSSEVELAGKKATRGDSLSLQQMWEKGTFKRIAVRRLSVLIVVKDISP
jgi:hypothetical protein